MEHLHQHARPSPHSYVVLLSHFWFFLPIWTCHRKGLLLETVGLTTALLVSSLYHACDEGLHCAGSMDLPAWHFVDVWATFLIVCFVLGVYFLQLPPTWAGALRVTYFVVITAAVSYDRFSFPLMASLFVTPLLLLLLRYGHSNGRVVFAMHFETKPFLIGMGAFGCALVVFVAAGEEWLGARRLHDVAKPKPKDVPDTTLYWALHSLWHVLCMVSTHLIISAKKK